MRHIALILLLLTCGTSFAQVSADSLKKACIRLYKAEMGNAVLTDKAAIAANKDGLVYDTVVEVFSGRFKDARLFVTVFKSNLDYSHGLSEVVRLYALDANTGQRMILRNATQFNTWMSAASQPLAPLDKAYLYLYLSLDVLGNNQFQLTTPDVFPDALNKNSILVKDEYTSLLFAVPQGMLMLPRMFTNSKMAADAAQSDYKTITMYALKTDLKKKCEHTYKYVFTFNADGELEQPQIVMYE